MAKKRQLAPKCSIATCSKRLDSFGVNCPKCGALAVCKEHVYDHECAKPHTNKKSSSKSTISVVKKGKSTTKERSSLGESSSANISEEEIKALRKQLKDDMQATDSFLKLLGANKIAKELKKEDAPLVVRALKTGDKKLRDIAAANFDKISTTPDIISNFKALITEFVGMKKTTTVDENFLSGFLIIFNKILSQNKQDFETELFCYETNISNSSADLAKVMFAGLKDFMKVYTENSLCDSVTLIEKVSSGFETLINSPNETNNMILVAVSPVIDFEKADFVSKFRVINSFLKTASKQGKKMEEEKVLMVIKFLNLLAKELKQRIMPYLLYEGFSSKQTVVSILLNDLYSQAQKPLRSEIKKCLMAICKQFSSLELDESIATIFAPLRSENKAPWRSKVLAFNLISFVCKSSEKLKVNRHLPSVVEFVIEYVSDIKQEVAKACQECLDLVANTVKNPEIRGLLKFIVPAIKHYNEIDTCLDEIMDTTFVNVISGTDLALVMPLIQRSLKEPSNEVVKRALITVGNICSLVANVGDIKPYVPGFFPEFAKLKQHSSPEIRKLAQEAIDTLSEGLDVGDQASSGNATDFSSSAEKAGKIASARRQRLTEETEEELKDICEEDNISFDLILQEMLAQKLPVSVLKNSMNELEPDLPTKMIKQFIHSEIDDSISALLKKIPGDFKERLQTTIADTILDSWLISHSRFSKRSSRRKSSSNILPNGDATEKDYLVYIPSIILAFASRLLLKRTRLSFEKKHVYGFVGQNGVGKTTLLNRIAERDILGFPQDIRVFYVRHEIVTDNPQITVTEYMKLSYTKLSVDGSLDETRVDHCLTDVGFDELFKKSPIANLSGGWKMKLAIAESMLFEPDLLLLDEPTNHLDTNSVQWLTDHLNGLNDMSSGEKKGTTVAVVSHDYDFLGDICSDIIHISNQKLSYYECGFSEFQKLKPEIVAALPRANKKKDDGEEKKGENSADNVTSVLEALSLDIDNPIYQATLKALKPIKFPEGSKLEGLTSRGKTVLSLDKVIFKYPGTEKIILNGVTCRLNLNSRVALIGKNGAGKSTLIKLLVGLLDLEVDEDEDEKKFKTGKTYKHHNLRTAYIAQHSLHHLEENLEQTPCQYIQKRFFEGRDREMSKMLTLSLTPEEEEKMKERGEICGVISRVVRGKKLYYEVQKTGRTNRDGDLVTEFKSIQELELLNKPHAVKICRMFDERLKASSSGMDTRPLTTPELIKHLKEFGIEETISQRKIRWMSGGQKCRLVLAAAMWTRPHLIALDEPTNYLDNDTLAALTAALRAFRGGVVTISHHDGFVNALAKELWHVGDGKVTVEQVKRGAAI